MWAEAGSSAAYIALALAAAFFSIKGMVVIFPGASMPVVCMTITMEAAKRVTAGWLARRWSATARVWQAALVMFVFWACRHQCGWVYA